MSGRSSRTWIILQAGAVAATAAILLGLVTRPDRSLTLLWKVVIPLVPASLLVSPMIWRNVCPLATLNLLTNRFSSARDRSRRWTASSSIAGMGLLGILVPARHFVFDTDGPALAATIAAVGAAALVMGALFDVKGGFCNAFCPVLPVERLYGQSPLAEVGNARCMECTLCSHACLDLSPRKSILQVLGRTNRPAAWTTRPMGAFAAAFPGFVVGYFTSPDAGWESAPGIYLSIGAWALGSWVATSALAWMFGIPARAALPSLAALAVGAYYAFAAPDLAQALGLPAPAGRTLQVAALGLVTLWWWRARGGTRVSRPARCRGDLPTAARGELPTDARAPGA